jgi:hypothetical protein
MNEYSVQWLDDKELEKIWREAVVANYGLTIHDFVWRDEGSYKNS